VLPAFKEYKPRLESTARRGIPRPTRFGVGKFIPHLAVDFFVDKSTAIAHGCVMPPPPSAGLVIPLAIVFHKDVRSLLGAHRGSRKCGAPVFSPSQREGVGLCRC